ncbi:MAG: MarR family winged helix-turn-helix transcriptional regulator [Acidimicrobiia bacterium]
MGARRGEDEQSLALRLAADLRELRRVLQVSPLKTWIYGQGMELGQVDTMDLLAEGPWRAGDLATALRIDASTLTRAIDRLVRKGLVVREADRSDGRAVVIKLTPEGADLHLAITARRVEVLKDLLADFTADEQDTLAELVGRFSTAVVREAERLADDPQARDRVMGTGRRARSVT